MAAALLAHNAHGRVAARSAGSIPAGQSAEAIRPIRDDIDTRVQHLLDELVPTT